MKEDTVYPGCTLAESTTTSLLEKLPMFIRGISMPSKELVMVCTFALEWILVMNYCSFDRV